MSIVSQITGVFKSLADWFVQTLPSITEIFYDTESGLTFLGSYFQCRQPSINRAGAGNSV